MLLSYLIHSFPRDFPSKILYAFLISPILATSPAHRSLLYFTVLTIHVTCINYEVCKSKYFSSSFVLIYSTDSVWPVPPSLILNFTLYKLFTFQQPRFSPEVEGSMSLRDVGAYLQVHKALQHTRPTSTSSPTWDPQTSYRLTAW